MRLCVYVSMRLCVDVSLVQSNTKVVLEFGVWSVYVSMRRALVQSNTKVVLEFGVWSVY